MSFYRQCSVWITLLAAACTAQVGPPAGNRIPQAHSAILTMRPLWHNAVEKSKRRPVEVSNVLLITVDALRADQPWSGYPLASTPNLSKLAASSVVFTHVYSAANTTTPSLAAILSGRYPTELKRDRCMLTYLDVEEGLASFLSKASFSTIGVHGHPIFAGNLAPRRGFSDWRLVEHTAGRKAIDGAVTGNDIATILIDFLQQEGSKKRFFAWAHFVDPHDLYVHHDDFPPSSHPVRGLYDGEVAYVDHAIGRVLDAMSAMPLAEKTAVVISADHGESFGEHGYFRHGYSLFDEEVRVPLILYIPGIPPRRIDTLRSTLDLTPTIAELLDLDPPAHWRGTSLLEDVESSDPQDRPILIDAPDLDKRPSLRAVVWKTTKVMFQNDKLTHAFDLSQDPQEHHPLLGSALEEASVKAKRAIADMQIKTATSTPCELVLSGEE